MSQRSARDRNPFAPARGAVWAPLAGLIAGIGALAASSWPAASSPGVEAPASPAVAAPAPEPTAADAGHPSAERLIEIPVTIPQIDTMYVGPHGRMASGFDSRSSCNVVSSLTDASFTGGSYFAQAGFAQTEIFAATYTLAAADFPIKINLCEQIFATSNAVISTTTQWSILFWSGNPSTGTLVDSFSSDDVILPHIHLGPGTGGVNVNFSVDPGDPEQIIITDNGSHQFTVGWRIDHHNQQTQNPCSNAPPTCCNAFPCTDVSGLAFGNANWLYGVNCGPFGCPPNGGWKAFSGLATGCRPTGDVVTRTTWSSVACQPGVGPCCLSNGVCQVMTTADCSAQGGIYQGDGPSCAGVSCPVPKGACCFNGGFCINNLSQTDCAGAGGSWLGVGTACNGSQCPTGACCLPNGGCVDNVTQANCTAQGGTFKGAGSTCATSNCPQPTGACCTLTGFCLVLKAAECAGIQGATWKGAFTTCVDGDGDGHADICPCVADYDVNTFVNGDDFDFFVYDFEQGSPAADIDHNAFVNGDDFDTFMDHFVAGC